LGSDYDWKNTSVEGISRGFRDSRNGDTVDYIREGFVNIRNTTMHAVEPGDAVYAYVDSGDKIVCCLLRDKADYKKYYALPEGLDEDLLESYVQLNCFIGCAVAFAYPDEMMTLTLKSK
jgi:hypothetical protein